MNRLFRATRERLVLLILLAFASFFFYQVHITSNLSTFLVPINICQGEDAENCPRPLRDFPSKYRSALPSFPITSCVIEKSMSLFLTATMCYLHDPEAFKAANKTLNTEMYTGRFCEGKNEFDNFDAATEKATNLMTIVRDPLERFVSGYVNKCIKESKKTVGGKHCYGCDRGDIMCFLNEQYKRVMLYSSGELRVGQRNFYDVHFFPQNWYCGFSKALSDYKIIRYGGQGQEQMKMADEITALLEKADVPREHIQFIRSSLLSSRSGHATEGSPEKEKYMRIFRNSEYMMSVITRMFYYDYVLFGFPFPTIPRTSTYLDVSRPTVPPPRFMEDATLRN